jgi:transposase-like protein
METRPGKQRRRFSEQERQQLLAAWRKSGLSADEFSQKAGLCRSNLWRWSRAQQDASTPHGRDNERRREATKAASFIELQVGHGARIERPASAERTSAQTPVFEVEAPFGLRVRVYAGADAETLRQLFELLPGATRC